LVLYTYVYDYSQKLIRQLSLQSIQSFFFPLVLCDVIVKYNLPIFSLFFFKHFYAFSLPPNSFSVKLQYRDTCWEMNEQKQTKISIIIII